MSTVSHPVKEVHSIEVLFLTTKLIRLSLKTIYQFLEIIPGTSSTGRSLLLKERNGGCKLDMYR